MSYDRNALCSCGSGKKAKKCCGETYGPCTAPLDASKEDYESPCNKKSCGAVACNYCDKTFPYCHEHLDGSKLMAKGHVLRTHPEKISRVVADLAKSDEGVAKIRSQHAKHPELWQKLIDAIDGTKN